ncbi:MAG: hypothetical protein ACRENH_02260, partial [Gemmatimonadaceae bacterium]
MPSVALRRRPTPDRTQTRSISAAWRIVRPDAPLGVWLSTAARAGFSWTIAWARMARLPLLRTSSRVRWRAASPFDNRRPLSVESRRVRGPAEIHEARHTHQCITP